MQHDIFDKRLLKSQIQYDKNEILRDRIGIAAVGIGAVVGAVGFFSSVGLVTGGLYGASLGLGLGALLQVAISQVKL